MTLAVTVTITVTMTNGSGTLCYVYKELRAGVILGMDSANERRRYYVTPPLIGRAHTQNDPC